MEEHSRIAIIGDKDTIEGLEIAGVVNGPGEPTVIIVAHYETAENLARIFQGLLARRDVGIIFICSFVASKIAKEIEGHKGTLPSVLTIPSKNKL